MSPKPDLHEPRAKIARAFEHREQLDRALFRWTVRRPIGIRLQRATSGWTNLIYVEREPIPLRVGAIFTDLVNNLQSALDLLVRQLVIASGNTPSPGNCFPVLTDSARWESARREELKGVKDGWADVIRDAQPFEDAPNAYRHWLVVLQSVSQLSKHRMLMPAVVRNMQWEPKLKLNRDARAGRYAVSELDPFGTGSKLRNGDVLVRVRVESATGDLSIVRFANEEIRAAVDIGWEDAPVGFEPGDEFPDLPEDVAGFLDVFT